MADRKPARRSPPDTPRVKLDDTRIAAYTEFAGALADTAAAEILPYFRADLTAENKACGPVYDPVTLADRAAELAIRAMIYENYPEHGVLGEEFGMESGSAGLTWVVDPIDGTKSFITGLLHWATLVALYDGEEPCLGVVNQPFVGERFVGSRLGAKVLRRGEADRNLKTRRCHRLEDAILCATARDIFAGPEELEAFDRVARKVRMVRYGGDCYIYCMLAAGLIDVVIESTLGAYDVQALIPLIEAAGGTVTAWTGASAAYGGRVVAAGDPRLHEQVLKLLQTSP